MSECLEQQEEEVEVLQSIYEGDECFKQISSTCFQYKYGDDEHQSILVEISWPATYPETVPDINMDTFHNGYLPAEFKNEIKGKLCEEANNYLDCAMTFSLFDWMKENADSFIARIPELVAKTKREEKENNGVAAVQTEKVVKEKKEQLTKAQKRNITNKTNFKGEHERGWNWVDVVKHLSQTGGAKC